MEDWDSQKMLDLYIYDYLLRKNMHTTAKMFSTEANFCPENVAVNTPEGFLPEWWSLFWDTYSYQNNVDATKGYSSMDMRMTDKFLQNSMPSMPWSDMCYELQNVYPPMQTLGFPNQLQTFSSITPPNPDTGNFLQSVMLSEPQFCLNRFGIFPTPDFSVIPGTGINNLIVRGMHKQEHLMVPTVDLGSNSLLRGALQAPSNTLPMHEQGQPRVPTVNLGSNSLLRGAFQTPFDASSMHEQEHPRVRTIDLTSNSMFHGALQTASHMLLSSGKSRQPEKKKGKNKRELSVTRDKKCSRPMDADCAPKAMQIKEELADTGSTSSSNSTRF